MNLSFLRIFIFFFIITGISCLSEFSLAEKQQLFEKFILDYNRVYSNSEEKENRFEVFQQNLKQIDLLNSAQSGTAEFGINQFADLSEEEFQKKYLLSPRKAIKFDKTRYHQIEKSIKADDSFDWRNYGAVTPVKDQGTVGTCWAFSTVGNIEGQHYLSGHSLMSLSEEQIVDCDATEDINNTRADCGVFGGWPYLAYQYVIKAGGLTNETEYDYCSGSGQCYPCAAPGYNKTLCGPPPEYCNATQWPCRDKVVDKVAQIDNWEAISDDEDEIAVVLEQIGPLSVLLDASFLQLYKKGIFDPIFCSKTELDHAVLMVGYGVDSSEDSNSDTPYWIIKNSWGEKWGEEGYFRIRRGKGTCGINTEVTTSLVTRSSEKQNIIQ